MSENNSQKDELGTILAEKNKTKRPKKYKVFLHNDDYTTMEFVVHILQNVFKKAPEVAKKTMLDVHQHGIGLCGIFSYEIAETKMIKVKRMAHDNGHPLKCTIDPE